MSCNDADDCNTYRYPEWQPPGEGECPDTCVPPGSTTEGPETTTIEVPISDTTTGAENPDSTTGAAGTITIAISLMAAIFALF